MLDKTLETLVAQSPGAVAVIVVVVLFLKFLRDDAKSRLEALRELKSECHEVTVKCTDSLDRNTEMLGRVSRVIDEVERRTHSHG